MQNCSIIISHYEKIPVLLETLTALKNSPMLCEDDQVIISDDGSSESPYPYLKDMKLPNMTYISYPRQGYRLNSVRNRGIQRATHDMIWMLDADCEPHPLCLAVMKESHRPDYLLSGRIDRVFNHRFENHDARIKYPGWSPFATYGGNMCFSRDMAYEVGLFDQNFNGAWGAGETEFSIRMAYNGVQPVYEPCAVCYHHNHPRIHYTKEGRDKNRAYMDMRLVQYHNPVSREAYFKWRREWAMQEYPR